MKVLLRSFNRDINSKTGDPLPKGRLRAGWENWQGFEAMLLESLEELGLQTDIQPENPKYLDRQGEYEVKLIAHKTSRTVPGDECLFYMQVHLANLFTLDPKGWGVEHSKVPLPIQSPDVDPAVAKSYCRDLARRFLSSGKSKHLQPNLGWRSRLRRLRNRFKRFKYQVLVPLQVPRDYVNIFHSEISVMEFLSMVEQWADLNPHICFLVKLHPFNIQDFDIQKKVEQLLKSKKNIQSVEGNIQNWIDHSDGVLTINSGVGFESLIHGKPVVTLGDCDYRGVTWAAKPDQGGELSQFLDEFGEEKRQRSYDFVYFYCREHAYDIDDPGTKTRLKSDLRKLLGTPS